MIRILKIVDEVNLNDKYTAERFREDWFNANMEAGYQKSAYELEAIINLYASSITEKFEAWINATESLALDINNVFSQLSDRMHSLGNGVWTRGNILPEPIKLGHNQVSALITGIREELVIFAQASLKDE
jgi:hypothetical protein